MKNRQATVRICFWLYPPFIFLGLLLSISALGNANASEQAKTTAWSIARGGLLYDRWWAVLGSNPPEETHPLYPSAGKKKGSSTWRCKECHGWDYRGVAGAYGKGGHYTGIKGLRDVVGVAPEKIAKTIREQHGYTEDQMPPRELQRLALFVSLGQIDTNLYVDRDTKSARGDAKRGAAYYQTICTHCHGFDGKVINFKDEVLPEYIGTIARDNPWEFLHKARFGQPGAVMVSLTALPFETIVDLLAYAQTLPAK